MDYYHSQNIQSPPIRKLSVTNSIGSHSSTETGKSANAKKISSDIHLFLAEQDEEEFAIRKPSIPKSTQKKETKAIKKETKVISMTDMPTTNISTTNVQDSKSFSSPKKNSNRKSYGNNKDKEDQFKYAGGGYEKSPNPKQLSKPNLISPAKKEKKTSEPNSPPKSQNLSNRFAHSVHSHSTPNLINPQVPFSNPSNQMNVIPPISSHNFNFGGQAYYFTDSSSLPTASMTREEANQDLRRRLNIV